MDTDKRQQKRLYKKLSADLWEWFCLYDKDTELLNKTTRKKYRLIKKSLRKDFSKDASIAKHTKSLPSIWLLTPRLVEVIIVSCFITFHITNELFLKIFIGVPLRYRGREFDAIYFFTPFLFFFVYILLGRRRETICDKLEKNLRCIRGIAEEKSKKQKMKSTVSNKHL